MRQITGKDLIKLIAVRESPCISLYQPTHRQFPENEQDPIDYRNLVGEMEDLLDGRYSAREVRPIVDQFRALEHDDEFRNRRTNGIAIFGSPNRFEVFELERSVPRLLVVADSFHTKPLIRILQSANRFQVLSLNRQTAALYEGNRDRLAPVDLTGIPSAIDEVSRADRSPASQMIGSYGTRSGGGGTALHHVHEPQTDPIVADMRRFYRAVDRGIVKHHSRRSGLPLLLAALPESQELFRRVSRNPFLMPYGITFNPDALNLDELRERAWKEIRPFYLARLEGLKDAFHAARARQAGSADLSDVSKAAVAGRVKTLLVEAERVIPGVLDRTTGSIRLDEAAKRHADDLLDDLEELVMAKEGEVVVVPRERMPTDSGLAAIYRY